MNRVECCWKLIFEYFCTIKDFAIFAIVCKKWNNVKCLLRNQLCTSAPVSFNEIRFLNTHNIWNAVKHATFNTCDWNINTYHAPNLECVSLCTVGYSHRISGLYLNLATMFPKCVKMIFCKPRDTFLFTYPLTLTILEVLPCHGEWYKSFNVAHSVETLRIYDDRDGTWTGDVLLEIFPNLKRLDLQQPIDGRAHFWWTGLETLHELTLSIDGPSVVEWARLPLGLITSITLHTHQRRPPKPLQWSRLHTLVLWREDGHHFEFDLAFILQVPNLKLVVLKTNSLNLQQQFQKRFSTAFEHINKTPPKIQIMLHNFYSRKMTQTNKNS